MEIYSFYQMALIIGGLITQDNLKMFLFAGCIGLALWVGAFVLQGVGIYTMAKKQGLKNRALAFVPFANILYLGKLAGECNFFGHRMKRAGMYAMIAQIIATALCIMTIASEQYLWLTHGEPQIEMTYGTYYWTGLTGFAWNVARFYDISSYVLPIFQMFVEIFLVVLMIGLCKKYSPKNYMVLSLVTLFIPIARFFIIFAIRKRQPIDYEAYMRARHEAFVRRQQQYYGQQNSYGNPYGNPYRNPNGGQNSPYGQNPNAGNNAPNFEEPFEEFSSTNGGNTSSNGGNGEVDEFFS